MSIHWVHFDPWYLQTGVLFHGLHPIQNLHSLSSIRTYLMHCRKLFFQNCWNQSLMTHAHSMGQVFYESPNFVIDMLYLRARECWLLTFCLQDSLRMHLALYQGNPFIIGWMVFDSGTCSIMLSGTDVIHGSHHLNRLLTRKALHSRNLYTTRLQWNICEYSSNI